MSKNLFTKFFVLLLIVGLLFAVAPTKQAQAAAVVTTEAELRDALAGTETQIELGASFTLAATVDVNRSVSIDGKSFTITGPAKGTLAWEGHGLVVTANNVSISNLTITGSGRSNLVFYNVTGGSATNVILSNAAHAGMIVNSSAVTISNVTTTNNTWGGINVDRGSGLTTDPLLTVLNVTDHTSPAAGINAAIWVDSGNAAWVSVGNLYIVIPGTPLVFMDVAEYYTANPPTEVWVCPTGSCGHLGVEYSTIQGGINTVTAGGTVHVAAGAYTEDVTINKALSLLGAGSTTTTVTGVALATDAGMLDIQAANVTVEGFKLVGVGNKTIRVTTPTTGVTLRNNYVVGATNPGVNYPSLLETDYNEAQTNLTITGNTFENHGSQAGVYINPTHPGLTITNNTFTGDPTSGPVLGIDQMDGTEVITGNSFVGITSPYALFEGFVTVPIVDIFNANTWPAGYIASGKMVVPASVVYPSTNEQNRINNWGHVDFISADAVARTITLKFFPSNILNDPWVSCFERRTDGDTSQNNYANGGVNWNAEILDGLYPYNCYTGNTTPILRTYSVIDYIEIRLSFGPEKDERFYWTRFDLIDEVWVDDDFTSATPGWGVDHFKVIQDGINAVATNGIVHVAAGTYAEDIDVAKPVTLLGPNAGINPNTGTRVPEAIIQGTSASWVSLYVEPDTLGVTIDGFKFDGANLTPSGYSVGVAGDSSDFTVQNNVFVNNKDIAIMTSGVYTLDGGTTWLYDKWLTDIVIKDNLIMNDVANLSIYNYGIYFQSSLGSITGNVVTNLRSGIQVQPYWNTPGGGTVEGNTFNVYKLGMYFNYAEHSTADWLFKDNIVTGLPLPAGQADTPWQGIRVETFSAGDVSFEENQVTFGTASSTQKYLYFENNVTGGTSSATPNWWGSVTGPAAGSFVGEAQYLPYCLNPECTLLSQAKLSISPAPLNALTCGPQFVDVMVTDVADLTAYTMAVSFDPTKVRIDSVENGGFLHETDNSIVVEIPENLGNTTGKLIFSAYLQAKPGYSGDPDPVSGSGSLIRIHFTPLLGTTTFAVDGANSLLVGWPEAQPIPFGVPSGSTFTLTGGLVKNVSTSVNYCDLAVAVAQAVGGNTLQLLDNVTIPEMITVNKALTLDTNGKTISRTATLPSNNSFLVAPGGDLTITGGGTITTTTGNAIRIAGDATTLARVTLVNATLYGPNASVAIIGNRSFSDHDPVFKSQFVMTGGSTNETILVLGNGAEANITGGTLTGLAPIMGNGTVDAVQNINNGGTKITIGGTATITSATVAIYHPQEGLLTINGGTITGTNGIEMDAGDLVITGGTIQGTGTCATTPVSVPGYSTDTGDAILIFSRDGYGAGQTMDVTISGNPIITSTCYALREYTALAGTSRLGVATITGGEFTGVAGAVTFTTVSPTNLKLTDGKYNTDPGVPAADYVFTPYDTYVSGTWFMIDPVDITATTLAGTFTAGLPTTVTVTIADTDHTGPFEVVFTYPEGTSITYGANTYVCGSTGCPVIPVTLSDPGPTTLSFAVTLPGVGPYNVGVALNHVAGATDIRLLDSDSALGVVASGNFTVTGNFSMQGNATRAGVPVTFTWTGSLVPYGPTAYSTAVSGTNFSLTLSYGGNYTITTNQPRYLNVYAGADLAKVITLTGDRLLPELRLKAGNAVWLNDDNVINLNDANLVGTQWGGAGDPSLTINHGDVNFDNTVNIQDLALVGGNYELTSAAAYGTTWLP